MFRLAHLSDVHLGPLPELSYRELASKRITGYINWQRNRKRAMFGDTLLRLVADLRAQRPDHVAVTGDLVNLATRKEIEGARLWLEDLGDPAWVSVIPGNHDAYVPGSLAGLLGAVDPYAAGDDRPRKRFPYLRRRGPVAFVGLSSAVPTPPFVASGRIGRRQAADAEDMLLSLRADRVARVVMIHHPPHVGGAPAGRNLVDAERFERMIARAGAELVIHGHNHVGSVAILPGPAGPVPVVGAPSASARGGLVSHRAGYHVFTVTERAGGFSLSAELRGLGHGGHFSSQGAFDITVSDRRGRRVVAAPTPPLAGAAE